MIKVTDNHAPRLARITPALLLPVIGEELEAGAQLIVDDARASILDGAISGPGHVPSLPGEPPNADTHVLDQHIHVGELIETPGTIQTAAISDSDHAWLERGGSRVEPRPYMEPAAERARGDIQRSMASRIGKAVTG